MTYHLRTLILLVTFACVVVYLLAAAPAPVATYGLFFYHFFFVSFLTAGALYAGENLKAFCRGALLLALVSLAWLSWYWVPGFLILFTDVSQWGEIGDNSVKVVRSAAVGTTVLSLLMGMATLGFKRLVEPQKSEPPDTPE